MNTKNPIGIHDRIQNHAPYTAKQYAAIALAIGVSLTSTVAFVLVPALIWPRAGAYIATVVALVVWDAWTYVVQALDAIEIWAANKAAPRVK